MLLNLQNALQKSHVSLLGKQVPLFRSLDKELGCFVLGFFVAVVLFYHLVP